jgi:hypothetical protein
LPAQVAFGGTLTYFLPVSLPLGIALLNALSHLCAPEIHPAATIAADALQVTMPHKLHSAGRLRISFLVDPFIPLA